MATRTISTKMAIEGEAQFRQAIAACNTELKTLKSQLALVESEFDGNANSMEALRSKSEALSSTLAKQQEKVSTLEQALQNAKTAQEAYSDRVATAQENIARCESALEALQNTTGDTTEEQKALTEELEKWQAELSEAESYQAAATKGVENWQQQLNYAKVAVNETQSELDKYQQYMAEAEASTDKCATSIDEYGKEVKGAGDESKDFGQTASDAVESLAEALAAAGIAATVKEIASVLRECIEASIEFESALAGVAKTTNASDEELAKISASIKELSTQLPASATEIAAVAEAAGQLGIATEDIMTFTEVMINLGESTNISATEAAESLAQFANITGLTADEYENLGSAIVALGNNTATTESAIVQMATRMASSATLVGMTETEILALAAALSSVGVQAQAGGSAMQNVFITIEEAVQGGGDALSEFASVAGMTLTQFAESWNSAPLEALTAVIAGLAELDEQGGSTLIKLGELGITTIQQTTSMASLATALENTTDAIEIASTAWEENTALATEASTRYETTESRLAMCSNAATNLKAAIGDALTPALGDLADAGTSALTWATDFVENNEWLVNIVAGLVTAFATLTAGVTAYTAVTKLAAAASTIFSTALSALPVIGIVSAVAGLVVTLGTLAASTESTIPSVKELTEAATELNDALEESQKTYEETVTYTLAAANVADSYIAKLEELEAAGISTEEQAEAYHNTLVMLCQVVPELAEYIDLETDSINGGTEALKANTEAWKENALQAAYQEYLTSYAEEYAAAQIECAELELERAAAVAELAAAQEELADSFEREAELMAEAEAQAAAIYEEYGTLVSATDLLTQEYHDLMSAREALNDKEYEATQIVKAYDEAVETTNEALAEAEEAMGKAEAAVESLTEAQESGASSTTEMASRVEELQAEMDDLELSYQEAYAAAVETITGQMGYFDQLSVSVDTTVDDVIAALKAQTEYMYTYADNIKKAMEMGVDQGLIQELSDGSEESAMILAAIVEGGEGSIDELNEAFASVSEGTDALADAMAKAETDFDKKMDELVQDLNDAIDEMDVADEAYSVGSDNVQGLINGAASKKSALVSTYKSMAQEALSAYKSVMMQASPSKKMFEAGEFDIQGLIEGAESEKENLARTYEDMANTALESMTMALPSTLDEPRQSSGESVAALTALLERLEGAVLSNEGGEQVTIVSQVLLDDAVLGEAVTNYQLRKARARGV